MLQLLQLLARGLDAGREIVGGHQQAVGPAGCDGRPRGGWRRSGGPFVAGGRGGLRGAQDGRRTRGDGRFGLIAAGPTSPVTKILAISGLEPELRFVDA